MRILFHRHFRQFSGGHLKVWHYFQSVQAHPEFEAQIYFSQGQSHPEQPWKNVACLAEWYPHLADALFLAGQDWQAIPQDIPEHIPRINLIQHQRHADPRSSLYPFLQRQAIRIAVSPSVAEALRQSQRVNGPIVTIPNGIEDLSAYQRQGPAKHDLLIVANKQIPLGKALEIGLQNSPDLQGISWQCIQAPLPRPAFLAALSRAKITLFLPHLREGFYLPALEGMALGTLVICPDCEGNRDFCLHRQTALVPEYHLDALKQTIREALNLPESARKDLINQGQNIAAQYSLQAERKRFFDILDNLTTYWSQMP